MIYIIYIVLFLLFVSINNASCDDLHHLYSHIFVVRGDK